jgi:hypothetical protein
MVLTSDSWSLSYFFAVRVDAVCSALRYLEECESVLKISLGLDAIKKKKGKTELL